MADNGIMNSFLWSDYSIQIIGFFGFGMVWVVRGDDLSETANKIPRCLIKEKSKSQLVDLYWIEIKCIFVPS